MRMRPNWNQQTDSNCLCVKIELTKIYAVWIIFISKFIAAWHHLLLCSYDITQLQR